MFIDKKQDADIIKLRVMERIKILPTILVKIFLVKKIIQNTRNDKNITEYSMIFRIVSNFDEDVLSNSNK